MADQRDGSETRSAVAAIRLLMLTGCRLSEIQKLRCEYVDVEAGELRLPDSKRRSRIRPEPCWQDRAWALSRTF